MIFWWVDLASCVTLYLQCIALHMTYVGWCPEIEGRARLHGYYVRHNRAIELYQHFTTAIDTVNIRVVFDIVKNIILTMQAYSSCNEVVRILLLSFSIATIVHILFVFLLFDVNTVKPLLATLREATNFAPIWLPPTAKLTPRQWNKNLLRTVATSKLSLSYQGSPYSA